MAELKKLLNFIDGEFRQPACGRFFESFNPSTGDPHLLVGDSDESDVNLAVQAASRAFSGWSRTLSQDRARFLYAIADRIDQRKEELAQAESADQGKPVWLAKSMDIARAAQNFRFFAGVILHEKSEGSEMSGQMFNYILRRPVGVAGLISPWNLPLYLLTWKIAPAIAFGNTAVAKPSELTSHTAYLLAEIFNEVGLPKGVVNLVFGTGLRAGSAIVAHKEIPLISFTGGTATGKSVAAVAAPMFKKLSLELGGKNPNLIFDDADIEMALESTVRSSFLNQGEICLCGSRIYVQESLYDRFLEQFTEKVRALEVGDPGKKSTFIGPLVSHEHREKVETYLEMARNHEGGARIHFGGNRPELQRPFSSGYFVAPTIIVDAEPGCRIQREEIFGPVVTVSKFRNEDEAVSLANDTSYGLSATVWTRSLRRAHGIAAELAAGTVWINTWLARDLRMPFGGVKASGIGREGQDDSLSFFTEAKTVCVQHGESRL